MALGSIFNFMGCGPEERAKLLADICTDSMSKDGNNSLKDALFDQVRKHVEQSMMKLSNGGVSTVVVHEVLSLAQQTALTSAYPDIRLEFVPNSNNPHAMAAASRRIEYSSLMRRIHYDKTADCRKHGRDDYLCDVGGDFSKHIIENNTAIHSCCPIIDARDRSRYLTRFDRIVNKHDSYAVKSVITVDEKRHSEILRGIVAGCGDESAPKTNPWYCTNKAQHCDRTARYGILVHSNYDIPLRILGDILTRKKIIECYGSFIYVDTILVSEKGTVPGVECSYSYSADKRKLLFTFCNDSSLGYEHDVDIYISYLTTNLFFDSTGQSSFSLELLENKLGIQYFKIVNLGKVSHTNQALFHPLWMNSFEDMTRIVFFDVDYAAIASRDITKVFTPKKFFIQTEIVNALLSHAYSSTEAKFKPVELYNYLQSFTGRIFSGNDVTRRYKKLDFETSVALANVVYLYVFCKKYDTGKIVQQIIDCVQYNRKLANASLLQKLLGISITKKNTAYNISSCPVTKPLHALLWTLNRSPVDVALLLQKCVNVIECRTKIDCALSIKTRLMAIIPTKYDKYSRPFFLGKDLDIDIPDVISDSLVVDFSASVKRIIRSNYGIRFEKARENFLEPTAPFCDYHLEFNAFTTEGIDYAADDDELIRLFSHREHVRLDFTREQYLALKQALRIENGTADYVCTINRSELKLKEIMERFSIDVGGNAIDLCSGPGGFLFVLSQKMEGTVYYHYYKKAAKHCLIDRVKLEKAINDRKIFHVDSYDTDLTKIENADAIIEAFGSLDEKFRLFTADGALNVDSDDQEETNHPLIANELKICVGLLARGGTAIIKIFTSLSETTKRMLQKFLSMFEFFDIYTSPYTDSISGERYLIAMGFRPDKVLYDEEMESLYTSIHDGAREHLRKLNSAYKNHSIDDKYLGAIIDKEIRDDNGNLISCGVTKIIRPLVRDLIYESAGIIDIDSNTPVINELKSYSSGLVDDEDIHTIVGNILDDIVSDVVKLFPEELTTRLPAKNAIVISDIHTVNDDSGSLGSLNSNFVECSSTQNGIKTIASHEKEDDKAAIEEKKNLNDNIIIESSELTAGNWTVQEQNEWYQEILDYDRKLSSTTSKKEDIEVLTSSSNYNSATDLTSESELERASVSPNVMSSDDIIPSSSSSSSDNDFRDHHGNLDWEKVDIVFPNRISVNADGHCLFYALMGGDRNEAAKLRTSLIRHYEKHSDRFTTFSLQDVLGELKGTNSAGVVAAQLFSDKYCAEVSIVNTTKGNDITIFGNIKPDVKPNYTFVSELLYLGGHYEILCPCKEQFYRQSVSRRHFNHLALDIDALVLFIDSLLEVNKNTGYVSLLFSRTKNYHIMEDQEPKADKCFYNAALNFCYSHSECMNGKFDILLNNAKSSGYSGEIVVLFDNRNTDFELINARIVGAGVSYRILAYPPAVLADYTLISLDFSGGVCNYRDSILVRNARVRAHVESCTKCFAGNIKNNARIEDTNRINYYCLNDKVNCDKVDNFDSFDTLIKLVPYSGSNNVVIYQETDKGDSIMLPIPMHRDSVMSTSRKDLTRVNDYMNEISNRKGYVPVLAIDASIVFDATHITKFFEDKVGRIDIKLKRVDGEHLSTSSKNFSYYQPDFVSTATVRDKLINSLKESRELYKTEARTVVEDVKSIHDEMLGVVGQFNKHRAIINNKADYGMIDMTTGKFVVTPKNGDKYWQCAYDGKNLIDISHCYSDDKKKGGKVIRAGVRNGYVSVSSKTKLCNSQKIYCSLADNDPFSLSNDLDIELVEGVPGCGKTTYIINNSKFCISDNEHVILTAARESAEDIKKRIRGIHRKEIEELSNNKGNNFADRHLNKNYRTSDSFLMHYASSGYTRIDTIWFDEAMMKHFGDVLWCALLSGAKNLKIFGDRAQIPFINRNDNIKVYYSTFNDCTNNLPPDKFLSVSRRCPADVFCYLNDKKVYSTEVSTYNNNMRTVSTKLVHGCAEIDHLLQPDAIILCFTQAEKEELKTKLDNKHKLEVFTVHEYQGNERDHVIFVRLNPKKIGIYDAEAHILVALTRHKKKFEYFTVVDDLMSKICNRISSYTNSEISKRIEKLQGGGLIRGLISDEQYPEAIVTYSMPVTVDPLKQNKFLREMVENHGGNNVIPLRPVFTPIEVYTPCDPNYSAEYVSDPLAVMQEYYDVLMPESSTHSFRYDALLFEQDSIKMCTEEITYTPGVPVHVNKFDCLTPVLRTACPNQVLNSQKQLIKAFLERNGHIPDLTGIVDEENTIKTMLDNFVESYIENNDVFDEFKNNVIDINVDSIEDWLRSQTTDVIDNIQRDDSYNIFEKELQKYSFILKKLPKPKLELGAHWKNPSPQTIAHHVKKVNAIFCPVVKEIKRRLISVLRKDKIIFCDMSVERFEEILTYRFSRQKFDCNKNFLEVDFSKYDKSQGRIALMFEVEMMRKLGVPESLLTNWVVSHVYSKLYSPSAKFKAIINYQRKSGDAMTFFGNTLHLMAVLAYFLPLKNSFCLFSGDDSLMFSEKPFSNLEALSRKFAHVFNLEAKLLQFETPYFCSKFLFMSSNGKWVTIPDVLKVVTKLGRRDLVNYLHAEEYRRSIADVARNLGNAYYYGDVDRAMIDRYGDKGMVSYSRMYSAITQLISDDLCFRSAYYIEENDQIDVNAYTFSKADF
uniref:Replicase large subunit n=1 Tax=Tonghua Virga tick virus 1 TaxID=2972367 RepID=A0A9E7V203_9VIRU|nr:MAG: replicase protein [Tonghua Virga tick virus 1]